MFENGTSSKKAAKHSFLGKKRIQECFVSLEIQEFSTNDASIRTFQEKPIKE